MSERIEIFQRLLGTMRGGRLLDLATGHGQFALAARNLGWKVTAVDVRTSRMPEEPGVNWVQADVRELDVTDYDCIAILGLLYHLELEAQLDLLSRCAGVPTIVDTHMALNPDTEEQGYRGWYFDEIAGRTDEEWKRSGTASWENKWSFWADHDSLIRIFQDAGFQHMWELIPWYLEDRTFFVCL